MNLTSIDEVYGTPSQPPYQDDDSKRNVVNEDAHMPAVPDSNNGNIPMPSAHSQQSRSSRSRSTSSRLSRTPSPHPVKNQRCSSQPSSQSKTNVNLDVQGLVLLSDLTLSSDIFPVRVVTQSSSRSSSSYNSRSPSPRTPGRVQFSPEYSRKR